MEATPNLAEMNAEALREFAAALLGQLARKDETIRVKQLKIDQLTHEMATLKRWRFGRRSEQFESGQRSLLEESIDEDLEAIEAELKALQAPVAERQQKQRPHRVALPGHLPRREVRHEPEQTQCSCGYALERIGEDVSEKLDYTPGVFEVERHIRGKWVCRRCERLIQAPVPPQVIDKGIPTAGLLAQVLVAKYADHRVPRTRQPGRKAWSCARDEGRPLASGDQELDANHCRLLSLRAMVVSAAGKVGHDPAVVSIGETSESKPPVKCRNRIVDAKTGGGGHSGSSVSGDLKSGSHGILLEGGVTPIQAHVRNVGTCRLDAKGTIRVGRPDEDLRTEARHRDGAARSRAEGTVMVLDRRGSDILFEKAVNW